MSSFAITINTRVGINDLMIKNMHKWIKGQYGGAFVFEKEGNDRHIHAVIYVEGKRAKGAVEKPLKAMIKRCYNPEDYIMKVALKVKDQYSDFWLDKYMIKDGKVEYQNIPEEREKFYPSEEEQAKAMAIAENRKNWTIWTDLEAKWNPEIPINCFTVAEFLGEEMFVNRSIKVEMDDRKRRQLCTTFVAFMSKEKSEHLFLTKDQLELKKLMDKG